jgi:hypothetical protein
LEYNLLVIVIIRNKPEGLTEWEDCGEDEVGRRAGLR